MRCVRWTNWVILFVFVCGIVLGGTVAMAQNSPGADLQINIDKVLNVLKNPDYAVAEKRAPLRAEIEGYIHNAFDFQEFSARTVGSRWKIFNDDQKKRFDKAFADLLMATYLDKVEGYNGEKIAYRGEILSPEGNRAEVKTVVTLSDGKSVPVSYRMMQKQEGWVVYDVLIEGVSLIKNYRSQFAEVLSKGTPDQLIEKVVARVQTLKTEQKK